MEAVLRRELSLNWIKGLRSPSGGCCSNAVSYDSDRGKLFVKSSGDERAEAMLKGELASLRALATTGSVTVPQPVKLFQNSETKEWVFVMEHLDISPLGKHDKTLGVQLARLHLHNSSLKASSPESYVDKFGFECNTSCGLIPMPNPWITSWIALLSYLLIVVYTSWNNLTNFLTSVAWWFSQNKREQALAVAINTFNFKGLDKLSYSKCQRFSWTEDFYTNCRLQIQVDLLNKEHVDEDLLSLWSQLKAKLPTYFTDVSIEPALVHGDLWSGNAGEIRDSPGTRVLFHDEIVIFDPGSFYAHHEFDLAIMKMFGGFSSQFYEAYHGLIPRAVGFSARQDLYILFHYLNHWNHFGSSYRSKSLSIMKELVTP